MLNYYYIIYSFIILGFGYIFINIYKNFSNDIFNYINEKKELSKSDKIEYKKNENSNIKIFININKKNIFRNKNNLFNNNISNNIFDNTFDTNSISEDNNLIKNKILELPEHINILKCSDINISNKIDLDLSDKYTLIILKSFINIKNSFNNIFMLNNNYKINNLENFNIFYKNLCKDKENNDYNIILKLYSDNSKNHQFIIMKKNTLLKIKNDKIYKEILKQIQSKNIFLFQNLNDYYISSGNYYDSNITNEQIKNIFFDRVPMNIEKNILNLKKFSNFNKITIIYWNTAEIFFN